MTMNLTQALNITSENLEIAAQLSNRVLKEVSENFNSKDPEVEIRLNKKIAMVNKVTNTALRISNSVHKFAKMEAKGSAGCNKRGAIAAAPALEAKAAAESAPVMRPTSKMPVMSRATPSSERKKVAKTITSSDSIDEFDFLLGPNGEPFESMLKVGMTREDIARAGRELNEKYRKEAMEDALARKD